MQDSRKAKGFFRLAHARRSAKAHSIGRRRRETRAGESKRPSSARPSALAKRFINLGFSASKASVLHPRVRQGRAQGQSVQRARGLRERRGKARIVER